jgi:pyrroloquinoline quinone (PQQ) biosynthesis protein C
MTRAMDSFLTRLEAAIVPARERLYRTGLGSALLNGTVTMPLYKGYLRETYHFVRHTPRFLAAAASRFSTDLELVRKRFLHHAAEEFGHELLAVHDLEALGTPRAETLATEPLIATSALVAFHYYQAERGNPIGLLGTIYALEGLGQNAGPRAAKALASLGLPRAATTFITVHGELDVDHMEEAVKTIEQFVKTPEDERVVTYCARAAYELYALMFEAIFDRDGRPAMVIAPATPELATAGV